MGAEMSDAGHPTIAPIWRGRVRRERADEYEKYNYDVGIKPLIEKALGVQTFREDREHESEFMTISYWEDIPAMARFTGRDPTDIHHLDRDPEFLIEAAQVGADRPPAHQPRPHGLVMVRKNRKGPCLRSPRPFQ